MEPRPGGGWHNSQWELGIKNRLRLLIPAPELYIVADDGERHFRAELPSPAHCITLLMRVHIWDPIRYESETRQALIRVSSIRRTKPLRKRPELCHLLVRTFRTRYSFLMLRGSERAPHIRGNTIVKSFRLGLRAVKWRYLNAGKPRMPASELDEGNAGLSP